MARSSVLARFKKGIQKFNEGEFYDCHDILEDVWCDVRGETRAFYQGLIHAAVGYYHITVRKNPKGAISQLTKAINKFQPFSPVFQGVELELLISRIEQSIQVIKNSSEAGNAEFDHLLIPKLEFDESKFIVHYS